MTDLPYFTPILIDGDTKHPVALLQNDSFDPFPGILITGDGPDLMEVANEIARRLNTFSEK